MAILLQWKGERKGVESVMFVVCLIMVNLFLLLGAWTQPPGNIWTGLLGFNLVFCSGQLGSRYWRISTHNTYRNENEATKIELRIETSH
ncbi:hypothetical protein J3F83DRAFT_726337 [Trichoderma novae-zelandiae]